MKPTNHNEVEPVSMPTSSAFSTMDDAGRPQSVFVVVSYECDSKCFSSILQLDTEANTYEYVAHFEQPQGYPVTIRWMFAHLACSPEDLCMVSDWGPSPYQKCAPMLISLFNLTTKKYKSIKFPGGPIYYKHVVDMEEHIYFMGDSQPGYGSESSFARYNRLHDSWETLEPLPYANIRHWGDGLKGVIAATAVWNNTAILLTMVHCGMWAYDVATNKWYPVVDRGCHCDIIVGKVVLENTIYALTNKEGLIKALSIRREQTERGIEFIITLLRDILVPGIDVVKYDERDRWFKTRDLVHLGGDNLCIIQSANSCGSPADSQPIQVTYLKLEGNTKMTVTDTCVYNVELLYNVEDVCDAQFTVELCFSLPEYKATAFKEGNRYFAIDPFPEHYTVRPDSSYKDPPGLNVDFSSKPFLDNDSSQTNMIDEQDTHISLSSNESAEGPFKVTPIIPPGATVKHVGEILEKCSPIKSDEIQVIKNRERFLQSSEVSMIGEQGHRIHVFNIPPGVTVKQLEKSLKTFGPIKGDGIKVATKNYMPCATVEFNAAPSKQRALKALTIDIQGYTAVIGEADQSFGKVPPIIPPGATVKQVDERLEKFSPIKSDEIQVIKNKKGFPRSPEINMIGKQD